MNNKNNLKELSSIGFSDVIGTGVTALFWFFLASLIEPDQYGEIFFYLGIASIISSVVLFASQNTITVYIAKKIRIQTTLYFISLCAAFVGSLVVILWFYRLDIGLVVFAYVINTLAIGEILGKKLFTTYSKYVLIQKFSFVLLGISFFYLFGINGILYAIALSYLAYIIIIFRGLKNDGINFPLVKEHIGFITNNYFFSIIQIVRSQIDKIIIPAVLSFTILGNYALALQIMAILIMFPNIIYKYILPYDASGQSNKKIKLLTIIISILLSISGIILAPTLIPIILPEYTESILAIQIMSVVVIPTAVTSILTSKLLGMENSRHVLVSRLISLILICPGMVILGTTFEIIGIAWAYVIANTASAISLGISSYFIDVKNKKN
jgi:O-antigen/teichoic acid export membrane protein